MALAFTLGMISYWLLAAAGHTPLGFVMCAGLIFFARREIFPCSTLLAPIPFGPKYATAQC
jgi:hypothetical protein